MGTQFLTAGDLFVEIVDNADASDPPIRDEARMAAIKDGTFEDGPYRFDRYTGYNGIRQLYNRHGPAENIFGVAGGSGLNFEFVYDAAGSSFRPRWVDGRSGGAPTPSSLTRVDDDTVTLETRVQAPSRIDVETTFKVVAPHYIDLTTVVRAHPGSFTGDWLGLFWACYIRRPEVKTTYVRARPQSGAESEWMATLAEPPARSARIRRGARIVAASQRAGSGWTPAAQHSPAALRRAGDVRPLAEHGAGPDAPHG